MRSLEEALNDVYARAEKEKNRREERKTRMRKLLIPALSVCLVIALGAGVLTLFLKKGGTGDPFPVPEGYPSLWRGMNAVIVRWGEENGRSYASPDGASDGSSGYSGVGVTVETLFGDTMTEAAISDAGGILGASRFILMPSAGTGFEEGETALVFLDKVAIIPGDASAGSEGAALSPEEAICVFVDPPAFRISDGKLIVDEEEYSARYSKDGYMPVLDYLERANEYVTGCGADVAVFGDGMDVGELDGYFSFLASSEEADRAPETAGGEADEFRVYLDVRFSKFEGLFFSISTSLDLFVDGGKIATESLFVGNAYRGGFSFETQLEKGEHTVSVGFGKTVGETRITVDGEMSVTLDCALDFVSGEGFRLVIGDTSVEQGVLYSETVLPDCTGMTIPEAREKLKEAGFDNVIVSVPGIFDPENWMVSSTNPEPGSLVDIHKWIHLQPVRIVDPEQSSTIDGLKGKTLLHIVQASSSLIEKGKLIFYPYQGQHHIENTGPDNSFDYWARHLPDSEMKLWKCDKAKTESGKVKCYISYAGPGSVEKTFSVSDAQAAAEIALTNMFCPDSFTDGRYDSSKLRGAGYRGIYKVHLRPADCYYYKDSLVFMKCTLWFDSFWGFYNEIGGREYYLVGVPAGAPSVEGFSVVFDGENYTFSWKGVTVPPVSDRAPAPKCDEPLTVVPQSLLKDGGVSEAGEIETVIAARMGENYLEFNFVHPEYSDYAVLLTALQGTLYKEWVNSYAKETVRDTGRLFTGPDAEHLVEFGFDENGSRFGAILFDSMERSGDTGSASFTLWSPDPSGEGFVCEGSYGIECDRPEGVQWSISGGSYIDRIGGLRVPNTSAFASETDERLNSALLILSAFKGTTPANGTGYDPYLTDVLLYWEKRTAMVPVHLTGKVTEEQAILCDTSSVNSIFYCTFTKELADRLLSCEHTGFVRYNNQYWHIDGWASNVQMSALKFVDVEGNEMFKPCAVSTVSLSDGRTVSTYNVLLDPDFCEPFDYRLLEGLTVEFEENNGILRISGGTLIDLLFGTYLE
ncbi:MAG: PASTA domain-containing protein [Clostridia bacterium]|nr:PASTA domain-containing protein [Clostridia bacterium]